MCILHVLIRERMRINVCVYEYASICVCTRVRWECVESVCVWGNTCACWSIDIIDIDIDIDVDIYIYIYIYIYIHIDIDIDI